jgi:curved DNA-binding protein CbpA
MRRTLYEVLMVHPRADQEVITVVYRHLAKRFHPDRDPSPLAQSRMAELNEAYEVLDDPQKRARYDELLSGGRAGAPRPTRKEEATTPAPTPIEPVTERTERTDRYGEAGPPPPSPEPVGSAMTFGRYRGWALNQVARFDRDYIEWLARTPAGRTYREELDQLLRRTR